MDFLRGKLKSQTPSLVSDDTWRTRSTARRRDDIFTSSYSRLRSSGSGYKSSLPSSYGKYSSYSPSPLNSPSLVRTRKLSITNNNTADDVRNTKNRLQSSHESSLSKDDTDRNIENNAQSVNYKELYEEEKKEKENCEAKLRELEKHLEVGLQRFLDLKKILDNFKQEIEYSDESIDDFIRSIVPTWGTEPEITELQNSSEDNPEVQPDPTPPLPNISYDWIDVASPNPPTYVRRIGRFTAPTSSRTEKLKLNFVFEGDSRQLPTKLHIEIKDAKGRTVFRKRQNVYYVKLQEDISTLNSEENYTMTVTSIFGPETASCEFIINNKNFSVGSESEAIFSVRSPSECSHTSGFDERSLDSPIYSPIRTKEPSVELESFPVTDTPLPDLEEISRRENAEDDTDNEQEIEEEVKNSANSRKNSFLLIKKLIIPEVQYKWHRGFRRDINGRYIKVTVLKLQFKYEDHGGLVPWEINIYLISREGEESENYKAVPVSDNIGTAELTVDNEERLEVAVYSKERSGKDHITAPPFNLSPELPGTVTLGEWHLVQPMIKI